MRRIYYLFLLLLVACTPDSFTEVSYTTLNLSSVIPDKYKESSFDSLCMTFRNAVSNISNTIYGDETGSAQVRLESGLYNIYISLKNDEINVNNTLTKVDISGDVKDISVTLDVTLTYNPTWVIKEIYNTGSKTLSGSTYNKDQFVEIYNNSQDTLYADSLLLCETYASGNSFGWAAYLPNNVAVGAIYGIPGTGYEHPVAPGKSIVLANQAQNHHSDATLNPLSPVDLGDANYEWYDEDERDVDNPAVPNMDRYFCYSNTVWILAVTINRSILIAKVPNMETFLKDNLISKINAAGTGYVYSYLMPRDYIIDGVEVAPQYSSSKMLPSTIDAGHTFVTSTANGCSMRRKVRSRVDGMVFLQDTDNSTNDFETDCTPSPFVIPNEE